MANKSTELAAIRSDEMYPLEVFERRVGLGRGALRAARQNGLKTIYVGARAYVMGKDWFEYCQANGREAKNG